MIHTTDSVGEADSLNVNGDIGGGPFIGVVLDGAKFSVFDGEARDRAGPASNQFPC